MLICRRAGNGLAGLALLFHGAGIIHAAPITADISTVKPGPITVTASNQELAVEWSDTGKHRWKAVFALDSKLPLITSISSNGATILEKAVPFYRCSTGIRTGGWDAFFDFPPARPQGTRTFVQSFHPTSVTATTIGDRVEVSFNGMEMGIFSGTMRYVFYPQSALIQQVAVLETNEQNVAYTYDAGIQMSSEVRSKTRAQHGCEHRVLRRGRQAAVDHVAVRIRAAHITSPLSCCGRKDGGRQHRCLSAAAPISLRSRLHH